MPSIVSRREKKINVPSLRNSCYNQVMVNEINKLIYNSLLKFSAIHLPHVGTLYIKHSSATLDGREIKAPTINLDFSSSAVARSLVDIIMNECSVNACEAEEIYARWFNKVRNGSVTTIEGVGTLRNKSFVTDQALLARLNEHAIVNLRLPRKGSAVRVFSIIASVLIIIAIGAFIYSNFYMATTPNIANDNRVATVTIIPAPAPETTADEVVTPSPEELSDQLVEVVEELEPEIIVDNVDTEVVSQPEIGHMVVIGSFQTEENAERYCSQIERKMRGVDCRIRTLGRLYAVIVYVSEDRDDCQEFISRHIEQFPQAWIHTPRELR